MTRLTGTAWGLDLLPDDDWRQRALCQGKWAQWTEFLRIDSDSKQAAEAAHQCKSHCLVYAECLADAEEHPPYPGIVQAGRHNSRGLIEIDDSGVACPCRPGLPQVTRSVHGSVYLCGAGCRCPLCARVPAVIGASA